jgi:dipeptidyl aminopeptidase/acylaminoacyl peptidase
VVTVSRPQRESDRYRSVVWQFSCADKRPRRLTSPEFPAHSPSLRPDGRQLAFLSSRGAKHSRVNLLPLEGGEARAISHEHQHKLEAIDGWSPDGRLLLVRARVDWREDEPAAEGQPGRHEKPSNDSDGPTAEPIVANFLPYKLDGSGTTVGGRDHLFSLDVESGEMHALVEGDFDVEQACWSPDGTRLLYVRKRGGRQRHRSDLWIADADGGHPRQLTTDIASVQSARWSPGGDRISFGGSRREGDSLVRLWWVDLADDSLHCFGGEDDAEELELAVGAAVWHPEGDRLAVIAAHRGLQRIAIIELPHGRPRYLPGGLRHVVQLAPCADRLAFVAASARQAEELYSLRWDGEDEGRHSAFNRSWFRARERPRALKRRFRVPDGDGGEEQIDAWLLLPRGHGDGPFPLLVDMHGGPQSIALLDFAVHTYWYLLCSRGWAVLAPNTVGSGSYGARFARRLRGRWGELDLPQHLAIINQLQEQGIADDHIACFGSSYGGFLSAWAIGHADVFKAAVVSAPVANIESHAGTSDTGYYVSPYAMDGEIAQCRDRYRLLSPVEYCAGSTAATLRSRARTTSVVRSGRPRSCSPTSSAAPGRRCRWSSTPAAAIMFPPPASRASAWTSIAS